MLCQTPIFIFQISKKERLFITPNKTKKFEKDISIFMDKLSFEEKGDFIRFYKNKQTDNYPWLEWLKSKYPVVKIPCRECLMCRYIHSLEWTFRCWLEAEKYGDRNMFITLTYDDENLPEYGVGKEALSKFMRNLRQHFQRKHNHKGIRFFGSGEYGRKDDRPHYHLLIFNIPPFGDEKEYSNERGRILYQSKTLDTIWKNGSCKIGTVTQNSAAYVCQYAIKRFGLRLPKHFNPQFVKVSKQKGIGFDYLFENKNQIISDDEITLPNGKAAKIPYGFDKKLKEIIGANRYEIEVAKPRADKAKMLIAEEIARTGLTQEELSKQRIELIKKEIERLRHKFEDSS